MSYRFPRVSAREVEYEAVDRSHSTVEKAGRHTHIVSHTVPDADGIEDELNGYRERDEFRNGRRSRRGTYMTKSEYVSRRRVRRGRDAYERQNRNSSGSGSSGSEGSEDVSSESGYSIELEDRNEKIEKPYTDISKDLDALAQQPDAQQGHISKEECHILPANYSEEAFLGGDPQANLVSLNIQSSIPDRGTTIASQVAQSTIEPSATIKHQSKLPEMFRWV